MKADAIEVGKTYVGSPDHKRGFSSHRTVLQIDPECDLVTLRMEVGKNPPSCYVSHGTMGFAEFAEWADAEAPAQFAKAD